MIDGRLTSSALFTSDLELLAGAFALGAGGAPVADAAPASAPRVPFWTGLDGRVALGMKHVHLAQSDWSDLQGTLHLTPAALVLENLRAGVATGGNVTLDGTLFFAAGPSPYAFKASLAVADFDYGTFARALDHRRAPAIEGKFKITGQMTGSASDLAEPWPTGCRATSSWRAREAFSGRSRPTWPIPSSSRPR